MQGWSPKLDFKLRDFVASFGPAWVVMMTNVDAPSVITAAETGAIYGYGLIWLILLLTVPLFFIQEASGRIGAVTRKGLGEVIREHYSKRIALLAAVPMALTDLLTYVAEYLGIAIGMEILGVSPFISIPSAFLLHLVLVYKRRYAVVESILIGVSTLLMVSYIASLVLRGFVVSTPFYFSTNAAFLFLLAANGGALITPCMPFYQASATAEKNAGNMVASRIETLLGAIVSECLIVTIVMVSAGLHTTSFLNPTALAEGLRIVAGEFAPLLFGIGLVTAGFLALTVISLGSAWGVVEALGLPRDRAFWVYLIESIPAALFAVIASASLLNSILSLMIIFVFILIAPGIMMGVIAADTKVMGSSSSSWVWKIAYWVSLGFVVSLGVIFLVSSI
jgi:Mn2+/Fe2+ NRAMP family transporter